MTRDRMPSVSSMIRYMSPEAIAERRKQARENFGRITPTPGVASEEAHDDPPEEQSTPIDERVSAPSPWAQSNGAGIDPAVLPSATMPVNGASSAETAPPRLHPKAAPPAQLRSRRTWTIVAICAVVAVVGPIVMVVAGHTRKPIEQHVSVPASAGAAERAAPSASVPAPATSAPVAPAVTASPSSASTADPAPAAVTARPGPAPAPARPPAPPARTAAPTTVDAGPSAPPPPPKPTGNGDPLLNE